MSLWENIEKVGTNVTTAAVLAIGTAITWFVRHIITNGKRLDLLETEMRHRERLRVEDREALKEVRDGVKRLEGRIIKGGE